MRVLVIDDSTAVRSRLVGRLRDAGLEVIGEAAGSRDGLELARVHAPEAVVLDARLPDGSGIELLIRLKGARPAPFVVVITNETRYRTRCLALGADVFLDKSADFEAVAVTLLERAR
jgi:DNA-binding NarL/FixJ family response regulator